MKNILGFAGLRRAAQGGVLALILGASGVAAGACSVSISSVLPNNQAVLKANCGADTLSDIDWFDGTTSISPGGLPISLSPPVVSGVSPVGDIYFETLPLTSGAHSFTVKATGRAGTILTDVVATLTVARPALTVAVTPGGSVNSNPAGIFMCRNGSGTCAATYATGSLVTLTPTADATYTFTGWSDACNGTGSCIVGMNNSRNVTATFSSAPTFTVSGTANPLAGGSVSCNSSVTSGSTTTCTVTPNSPYTATGGSSDTCGGSLSGTTYTTGPVTSNCTVTVNFSQPQSTYTVTTNVTGSGTVSCSPNPVSAGGNINCTATAGQGWTFTNFTGSCGSSQFSNAILGPINSACTVTANFTQSQAQTFAVNGVANPPQGGSVSCNTNIASGATSVCTINTSSGYTLTGATSTCGGSLGSPQSFGTNFTTGAVTSNCTVTANFSSSNTGGGGGGNTSCGPNEVFGPDDIVMPASGGLYPSSAVQASGTLGKAIRFVADPNFYSMGLFDQTNRQLAKDFVISSCPHSFTPVSTAPLQLCAGYGVTMQAAVKLNYTGSGFFVCSLVPGNTYYLNFRSSNPATVPNVYSQILEN